MLRTGTANYINKQACINVYGIDTANIKLKEGLILIGRPDIKTGEHLLIDKSGRYHIETRGK